MNWPRYETSYITSSHPVIIVLHKGYRFLKKLMSRAFRKEDHENDWRLDTVPSYGNSVVRISVVIRENAGLKKNCGGRFVSCTNLTLSVAVDWLEAVVIISGNYCEAATWATLWLPCDDMTRNAIIFCKTVLWSTWDISQLNATIESRYSVLPVISTLLYKKNAIVRRQITVINTIEAVQKSIHAPALTFMVLSEF